MKEETYTYIVIDDEEDFRNQVITLVAKFNNAPQTHFANTFGTRIRLNCIGQHEGLNNNILNDIQRADIVFLDLRFDGTEMGINLLGLIGKTNRRNIIVLTGYREEYEPSEFPEVLSWLHKPLNHDQLEAAIDKFYIQKKNFRAVFRTDGVEIMAGEGYKIAYDNILCVKSAGQEVTLYFTDRGKEKQFSPNVFGVGSFDKKGRIIRISPSCAINLNEGWSIRKNEDIGSYAHKQGFNQLPKEELKVTAGFKDDLMIAIQRNN